MEYLHGVKSSLIKKFVGKLCTMRPSSGLQDIKHSSLHGVGRSYVRFSQTAKF